MMIMRKKKKKKVKRNKRQQQNTTTSSSTIQLYVEALEQCIETWQIIQTIPNYEKVVGELLFRQ